MYGKNQTIYLTIYLVSSILLNYGFSFSYPFSALPMKMANYGWSLCANECSALQLLIIIISHLAVDSREVNRPSALLPPSFMHVFNVILTEILCTDERVSET